MIHGLLVGQNGTTSAPPQAKVRSRREAVGANKSREPAFSWNHREAKLNSVENSSGSNLAMLLQCVGVEEEIDVDLDEWEGSRCVRGTVGQPDFRAEGSAGGA